MNPSLVIYFMLVSGGAEVWPPQKTDVVIVKETQANSGTGSQITGANPNESRPSRSVVYRRATDGVVFKYADEWGGSFIEMSVEGPGVCKDRFVGKVKSKFEDLGWRDCADWHSGQVKLAGEDLFRRFWLAEKIRKTLLTRPTEMLEVVDRISVPTQVTYGPENHVLYEYGKTEHAWYRLTVTYGPPNADLFPVPMPGLTAPLDFVK